MSCSTGSKGKFVSGDGGSERQREPLKARQDNKKRMNDRESTSDRMSEQAWSGVQREWASGKTTNHSLRCYAAASSSMQRKGKERREGKRMGEKKEVLVE